MQPVTPPIQQSERDKLLEILQGREQYSAALMVAAEKERACAEIKIDLHRQALMATRDDIKRIKAI